MTLTTIKRAGLDGEALDRVFTVGASGTDHYTFQGEGLNGTVNDPTLYLTRGKTYRFEKGSSHPLRIQSTAGSSGTAYNTGVTNNGGTGTVIIEVQHDAPDVLYYQCTSHPNMNGVLYITGALADGGVTTAKLAADAVTGAKLADNAVVRANITDGEVTSAKLDSNAVTTSKINNNAVTTDKIADDSIRTRHYGDNSIDTAFIADQAITLAKLEHGTSSNDGKFLRANNGADPSFESVPSPAITAINNATNNRIITSNGGTTVNAEANCTFDGGRFITKQGDSDIGMLVQNTTHDSQLRIEAVAANKNSVIMFADSNDGDVGKIDYDHNTDHLTVDVNAAERIRIDSSGRVGINRGDMSSYDGDAQSLVVGNHTGNDRAGITIRSSNSATGTIYFADGTGSNSYQGRINYYHNNNSMSIGAGGSNAGINIDSNCVVTTPNRPAFMAKLGQTAVINNGYRNYTNSDGLKVNGNQGNYLTTVDFNQGSHYNSSTTRFTAPVAGLYYFEVVLSTNSAGPSNAYLGVELYKNGTRYYSAWQGQSSGYQKVRQAFYLELSANDYVEPGYESQQTVTVIGDSAANKFFTYFTGYLIG